MKRQAEKGAVLVEGALVAGLFFMFLFCLIDVSLRWYAAVSLEAAASVAARTLSVTGSGDAALDHARASMPSFLGNCLSLDGATQYENLSSADFTDASTGAPFVSPASSQVRAVRFRLTCKWNYLTSSMTGIVGVKADIGTWAIAVMSK